MRPNAVIAVTLSLLLTACATDGATVRYGNGPSMQEAWRQPYNGPKARLAVVKVVDKTATGSSDIGDGLADMLTTALFHTNRYVMLDRTDLADVMTEQDLASSGRITTETGAPIGELEGAELLVFGAVTEFERDAVGAGGIILGAITLAGSIAIASANNDAPIGMMTYTSSHVAMDLKIVDAATGRVVYAGSVEGNFDKMGGGIIGAVGGGSSRVPIGLGGFEGTGAEEALRNCIDAAVGDVVNHTPMEYYRIDDGPSGSPVEVAVGQLVQAKLIDLGPAATAHGVKGPSKRVATDQKGYLDLILALKGNPGGAPSVDFSRQRVVAFFAGDKGSPDYRIGVRKVTRTGKGLSVTVGQEELPRVVKAEDEAPEPVGSQWPFTVVVIDAPIAITEVNWE